MATAHDPTPTIDPLDAVIASYVQAVEVGEVPNRQELLERHPDLADGLRAFFADFDRMDRVVSPIRISDGLDPTGGVEAGRTSTRPTIRYFGDYELLEEIAHGGMGVVYKARQVSLNRIVALKMVLAGAFASSREVERFRAEAEAAANLDHPHIVPIYEVGDHEGQQYYSMKFVEGTSLAQQPRGDARAEVSHMVDVALAVHDAHQHGILHRDLKPANVLVDFQGACYVTDFGLAKRFADKDRSLTATGQVIGTPRYMSPEQAEGRKDLTVGADVYSLGVILYERLTGRTPFTGEYIVTILRQVREQEPPRPSSIRPGLDRDLETVVLKCLEKDAGRRYPSAEALAGDLSNWLAGRPITARTVGQTERAWRWCRRNPVVAGLVAAIGSTIVVATLLSTLLALWALNNAWRAERLAKAERSEARRANQATRKVRAEKEWSEHLRYISEINAIASEFRLGNHRLARERLANLIPPDGASSDPRGFEWHYLNSHLNEDANVIDGLPDYILSIAFSPDGRRLAIADKNNMIRIHEAISGKAVALLRGHISPARSFTYRPGGVRSVTYSADGRWIATAGDDGTVRKWEAETGREVLKLNGHEGPVLCVAFSPDSLKLVSSGYDRTVRIWSAQESSEAVVRIYRGISARAVSFSPDGRRLVALENGIERRTLRAWDVMSGKESWTSDRNYVVATSTLPKEDSDLGIIFSFSPDGKRIVWPCSDNIIRVTDAESGRATHFLVGHTETPRSAVFGPDGKTIVSSGMDSTIRLWDAQSGRLLRVFRQDSSEAIISTDGRFIASFGGSEQLVHLWEPDATLDLLVDYNAEYAGFSEYFQFINNKEIMFMESNDEQKLMKMDVFLGKGITRSGGIHLTPSPPKNLNDYVISPRGDLVAGAGNDPLGSVHVWNTQSGRSVATLVESGQGVGALAFSSDGKLFATHAGTKIVIWSTDRWVRIASVTSHGRTVNTVAFSPDGRRLASGCDDGTITLWDFGKGEQRNLWRLEGNPVSSVVFSPDSRRLLVGFGFMPAALLDAGSGAVVSRIHSFHVDGKAVAFSPDGERIAGLTPSLNSPVKIWDARSGHEMLALENFGRSTDFDFHAISFSPDGLRLAAFGYAIRVWSGEPLNQEGLARRRFLGLIRFHLRHASSENDLRSRISHDATTPDDVRRSALEMLPSIWAQELERRSDARVDEATELNEQSWNVVKSAKCDQAMYEWALRSSEKANRLLPNDTGILNTLGAAQYRSGRLIAALATLNRSHELNKGQEPADLAFLAMSHQRLGQMKEAADMLHRLQELIKKDDQILLDPDIQELLREAEGMVLDAGFPANPFVSVR